MRLTITIIAILISTICNAQEILTLGASTKLKLPANAVKQTNMSRNANHKDEISQRLMADLNNNSYKIGTMDLRVNSGDKVPDFDYISSMKKSTDARNTHRDKSKYNSYIKTVKGNQVLIIFMDLESKQRYSFHLLNNKSKNVLFYGTLTFDSADKSNATKVVDSILNGVTFN